MELQVIKTNDVDSLLESADFKAEKRLNIAYGTSRCVKERKVQIGNFFLEEDGEFVDCGESIVVMGVAARSKAIQFKPNFIVNYEASSEQYKEIAEEAMSSASHVAGPELLLATNKGLVTLHLKTKTLRRCCKDILKNIGSCYLITVKEIENKDNSWYGIKAEPTDELVTLPADCTQEDVTSFVTAESYDSTEE